MGFLGRWRGGSMGESAEAVTQILEAIGPEISTQPKNCCRWSMKNSAAWPFSKLAHEKPGQTLQATALVHEAWLRRVGSNQQRWRGRDHFFIAAAEAMRRILVDNAHRKQRVLAYASV